MNIYTMIPSSSILFIHTTWFPRSFILFFRQSFPSNLLLQGFIYKWTTHIKILKFLLLFLVWHCSLLSRNVLFIYLIFEIRHYKYIWAYVVNRFHMTCIVFKQNVSSEFKSNYQNNIITTVKYTFAFCLNIFNILLDEYDFFFFMMSNYCNLVFLVHMFDNETPSDWERRWTRCTIFQSIQGVFKIRF